MKIFIHIGAKRSLNPPASLKKSIALKRSNQIESYLKAATLKSASLSVGHAGDLRPAGAGAGQRHDPLP
ncbi:hypothetical protein, partial [Xanthomonas oryzae]